MAHLEDEVLFEFDEPHLNDSDKKPYTPGFFEPTQQVLAQTGESERAQQDALLERAINATQGTTNSPLLAPTAGGTPININSPKKDTPQDKDQAYTFVREPRPVARPRGGI
jgi:hypothetical protein